MSPSSNETSGSWPDQATDLIVESVGTVRDKTVGPAMTVARGVVYGFFTLFLATVVLIMTCILVVRIGTVYIPGNRVWIIEGGLGLLLCAGGLWLWSKARKFPHR